MQTFIKYTLKSIPLLMIGASILNCMLPVLFAATIPALLWAAINTCIIITLVCYYESIEESLNQYYKDHYEKN